MTRDISPRGIDLIKRHEGFVSRPYSDPVGIPTIGYGATYYPDGRRVRLSDPPISEDSAELMLRTQLRRYADAVDRYAQVPLTQSQFDALVSFAYNVGPEALRNSTLLKRLNASDYAGAAEQFPRWNMAGGRVLRGLARRRADERALFLESTQVQP